MRSKFWHRVVLSTFATASLVVAGCGDDPTPAPAESPAQAEEPTPPTPTPQAALSAPAAQAQAQGRRELLVPGAPLPESFPRDLPVPPSSEQIAAYDGGAEHTAVIYESAADLDSVFSDLQARMASAGWQVSTADRHEVDAIIIASKGPSSVIVVLSPSGSDKTKVEITAIGSN